MGTVPAQNNQWEFCSRDRAQAGSIGAGSIAGAAGYPIENIIDGDRLSFVKYTGALPADIILDLQASFPVNRIFVRCPMFYRIGALTLWLSLNGSDYTEVVASGFGKPGLFTLQFPLQSARYIKLTITTGDSYHPGDLRIAEVAVFARHFSCDGLHGSLDKQMPPNPQTRTMGSAGHILVPLLFGNNFRLQRWGAERRSMTISFPKVGYRFVQLMEWYKDRGTAFGLLTHEFEFHNLVIIPGGWQVNELGSDGPGLTTTEPDWTEPSKSNYAVELSVQEVACRDPATEEEPTLSEEGGDIIMSETVVVAPLPEES